MTSVDMVRLMKSGVSDDARFRRDAQEWSEHPMTVRLVAALCAMREDALKTIATPIKKDEQVFFHNLNCCTADVMGHMLAAIESLTASTGGTR